MSLYREPCAIRRAPELDDTFVLSPAYHCEACGRTFSEPSPTRSVQSCNGLALEHLRQRLAAVEERVEVLQTVNDLFDGR